MEASKRGGQRIGAGRKPTDNPKRQIVLYVEKKAIWKFGNEEKLKGSLYNYISNHNIQDLNEPTNQIKPYEQPKTNFAINTPASRQLPQIGLKKTFQDYMNELSGLEYDEEYRKWWEEVNAQSHLTDKQKELLRINMSKSNL